MILYDNIFIWYYMIIWLWLDNVMIMIIGYYRWYIYIYTCIFDVEGEMTWSICSCQDLDAAIDLHVEEMTAIQSRIAKTTMDVLEECFPLKNLQREEAEDAEAAELVDLFDGLWRFQTYDRTESVYSNIPLRQALLTPWLYPLPPFAHCLRGSQTPCK